jgi:phosphoserine phosphatase
MENPILGNGKMLKLKVTAYTSGRMETVMKENGSTASSMEWAQTFLEMGTFTLGSTIRANPLAKANTSGKLGPHTLANSRMASKMVRASGVRTLALTATFTWVSSRMMRSMGYGEMFWNDGSIYKGYWMKGL